MTKAWASLMGLCQAPNRLSISQSRQGVVNRTQFQLYKKGNKAKSLSLLQTADLYTNHHMSSQGKSIGTNCPTLFQVQFQSSAAIQRPDCTCTAGKLTSSYSKVPYECPKLHEWARMHCRRSAGKLHKAASPYWRLHKAASPRSRQ